jgi:hypothetical protein
VVADFMSQFPVGIARKDTNIISERRIHRLRSRENLV